MKLTNDKTYKVKRTTIEHIQGVGYEQLTHIISYVEESIKSNSNSAVKIECVNSTDCPIYERIYVFLEAWKTIFIYTFMPLIGIYACF